MSIIQILHFPSLIAKSTYNLYLVSINYYYRVKLSIPVTSTPVTARSNSEDKLRSPRPWARVESEKKKVE